MRNINLLSFKYDSVMSTTECCSNNTNRTVKFHSSAKMSYNKKVVLQVYLMVLLLRCTCNVDAREAEVFQELIIEEDSVLDKVRDPAGCLIDINKHLSEPQPLLIIPGTNEFYLPQNKNGELSLEPNQALELFCSKSFLFPMEFSKKIIVSCFGKDMVLYDKSPIPFNSIKCHSHAFHTARQTYQSCYNDSVLIKIGFNISDGRFLDLLDVCYNEILETTVYTHHIQTPSSIGFQRSVKRPHFIRGQFFNKTANINKLFNKNKQSKIFEQILGHANISTHMTNNTNQSLFLVRGHLTPKVDFLFGSQQRATFWLINAIPQWQSFNSGNWERMEQGVRQLVADRNIIADIYTGTYGILTYKNADGRSNEIFLSHDENNNGVVPVPKLMYKVIVSVSSKMGIALLGVNNPFASMDEIQKEYVICDDVGDQVIWIKWDRKNIIKGYSYACELNEFLKVVKHLPLNYQNITLLV